MFLCLFIDYLENISWFIYIHVYDLNRKMQNALNNLAGYDVFWIFQSIKSIQYFIPKSLACPW